MEKKIKYFLFIVCFYVFAQEKDIIRPGLLASRLTISPSYFFARNISLFYLHGNLEGWLRQGVSLSGEGYYFLGTSGTEKNFLQHHHGGYFGLLFHKVVKNNDFYIGFQPGISFTQWAKDTAMNTLLNPRLQVNPMISCVTGYNLYFYDYFHFFIQLRYRDGFHLSDRPLGLSEIIISAGLGMNLNLLRD
ncbi:MAG: hypothetical protein N3F09_10285 [Bacteroidia bacterium]|nr:hypothetical protein [Bacteroidia bacterium]